jgi:hypothetical protein
MAPDRRHVRRRHFTEENNTMKRFIIEREIPDASELTHEQLAEISKTSNEAMASLGVPYRWVNSYVAIREHARRGGFPCNAVSVVANEFGPQTADLAVT